MNAGLAARLGVDVQLQHDLVALAAERWARTSTRTWISGRALAGLAGSRGARGFSNDRSLTYWVWIVSRGGLAGRLAAPPGGVSGSRP